MPVDIVGEKAEQIRELAAPAATEAATAAATTRWRTQLAIGAALIALALVILIDARRLPLGSVVGVGPTAAMKLVAAFVALLGLAHWASALRQRARAAASGLAPAVARGNHAALAWVLGGLAGLIAILQFGGGFIAGSAWLFVSTARGFGQPLSVKSWALGLGLSALVYLFFTKALSLSLPMGPLERLIG